MSLSEQATAAGQVVGLWRYPVKSMGAEALESVHVSWHGLEGDRRWAFVRDGVEQSGFPWFTLRQRADLNHFRPSFTKPDQPDTSPTIVRAPSGDEYDVTDPALAAKLSPGTRVIRQSRGIFDTFPISLITTQTVSALGKQIGEQLDVLRFRPNILIEASTDEPYLEDTWVGRVLRIGALCMRVDKRDGRCVVITIDPDTTERNPAVLRTVVDEREGCLGVYGSIVEPGRIGLRDMVWIEETHVNAG